MSLTYSICGGHTGSGLTSPPLKSYVIGPPPPTPHFPTKCAALSPTSQAPREPSGDSASCTHQCTPTRRDNLQGGQQQRRHDSSPCAASLQTPWRRGVADWANPLTRCRAGGAAARPQCVMRHYAFKSVWLRVTACASALAGWLGRRHRLLRSR